MLDLRRGSLGSVFQRRLARRMTWKGGELLHQAFNLSCFAEQMLVHENAMVKIDPDIIDA